MAEVDELVAAMPERWRFMAQVAAWTGLRFGELVELRRKDLLIGPDGATVAVRRSARRDGTGWMVTAPKTTAGVRTVTVPPHLVDALRAHLVAHAADGPDGLVFPTMSGQRLTPMAMARMLREAQEGTGKSAVRFHDLRHVAVTMAARAGSVARGALAG